MKKSEFKKLIREVLDEDFYSENSDKEVRKCPFCGKKVIYQSFDKSVHCQTKECIIYNIKLNDIEKWNKRNNDMETWNRNHPDWDNRNTGKRGYRHPDPISRKKMVRATENSNEEI